MYCHDQLHAAPRVTHAACQARSCLSAASPHPAPRLFPPKLLQIDKDEVRLRRTIGAKKDEYTLDRKHVT